MAQTNNNNKQYYADLGVDVDANEADIAQAYRQKALEWHPQLSKSDYSTAYSNFCRVAEAYQVLSDERLRQYYDRYGEERLKEGIFEDGRLKCAYTFIGTPEKIFEKFFGTLDPYAQLFDADGGKQPIRSLLGFAFDAQQYATLQPNKDLIVPIDCTLKELYNGCQKQVSYPKTVLNGDGRTTRQVKETKTVEIRPGFGANRTIKFEGLGNESAGVKNSDLIFQIRELADSQYKRKGNDLVFNAKVTLKEALTSKPFTLTTFDGRTLHVSIDEVISPSTVKIIEGEGMPIFEEDEFSVEKFGRQQKKGNLIIRFEIEFPLFIEEEKRERLKAIIEEGYI